MSGSPDQAGPSHVDANSSRSVHFKTDLLQILRELRASGSRKFWLALGFLVLGGLTEGISILALLPLLQRLVQSPEDAAEVNLGVDVGGLSFPDFTMTLPGILICFVGLVVMQTLFNRFKSVFLSDLLYDFSNRRRLSLFKALGSTRWDRITRMPLSRVEHALTGEIERISLCGFCLLSIIQSLVMIGIYVGLGFAASPQMTAGMLLFGILAAVFMRPFRKRAALFGQLLQESRSSQFRTVSDFVGGLKGARATNSEDAYYFTFSDLLVRNKADARTYVRYEAMGSGIFQLMVAGGAAFFIYASFIWLELDFARVAVLLVIGLRIAPRFLGLQGQVQQLLIDLPAWRYIYNLEQSLTADRDDSIRNGVNVPPLKDGIKLRGVSYGYEGSKTPALNDITMQIRARRITALIGPSGSGKSTIADLVTGLIRPSQGDLLFDGRKLLPEEINGWRARIAYVSQDSFLTGGSVRDNLIAMTNFGSDDRSLWNALEQADAVDFVSALPHGLDTLIGDRGVQLSGGQRQRIALARAFLRSPDFLVLDEATSALDWRTQERISQTVCRFAASGVTVLIIAHRPSMISFADEIYALDHGRVVEFGGGEELLTRRSGAFFDMMVKENTTVPD
ncbi:ABC transporter ATP-binding protein [Palleronia abyssalis]|uniref:Heterocyst differentiation ATP-binding protein HepA n=1 Tax=Palleronia abyssalis TaxID=1501240 RepID=A0A2R8BZG2_9RHOB|nr:ABC transporter ATP-binding protein [Palleronia abyssalis]SPJ25534.1 Heterocyst differentiation ATP-binding protein HepA [Palleronia abyssalis]